ncbi:class I SAM-dependent methyltransferase [Rosistilla ulvae]|uniref:class I SAM-dependent methyltransferase n=1 Tax=Rosistilla ulvae TaxID=1930277 RepID=UPI001C54E537|nr:class I SAM-dependent methyltransferase [Rosistilla ulvae]
MNTLRSIEACCGSLDGKSVLEVGSDPAGKFMAYISHERELVRGVGINPCLREEKSFGNVQLKRVDARHMPFGDNQFDVITSVSVLEHVRDLELAVAEMFRVVRPGGYLWAELGPVWSGSWGHHLWIDSFQGKTVSWRTHALPPYSHLLMTKEEMRGWCQKQYQNAELSEAIVEFVYHSDEQNRLFYSDYERIVQESPFETVFFVGIPDVPLRPGYECSDSATLFRELALRYPGKSGFGYHVICMLLYKPEVAV